jgi:EmrB/QacA subfamily drug resistance transporter
VAPERLEEPDVTADALNPAPRPGRHTLLLAIILTSYLMIVLDISIVITGLPRIRESLGFSAAGLSWVHSAYTLAFGGLLLLGARAGDLLGRRRMFIVGLGLFTTASLAIGLARSPAFMVAARALQGAGSAILAPSTLALISANFAEGRERTWALSWYGAAAGIGASIGLVLGGVLADLVSWRVGFFINLPIGVLLMLAAWRHVAETPRRSGRLDLAGALLSTLGMVSLVYGLVHVAHGGWNDVLTFGPLLAGLALLALFLWHEARAQQPILPLRLFDSRQRVGAYAARVLFLGGMVGFWFYTTQYLQGVLGMRPMQAGLAYLPATLVNFAVALAVPRLTQCLGNARLLALGLAVTIAGMTWLSLIGPEASYFTGVALPMVLIGAGQGGVLSPLTVAGVAGVAPEDAGAASGLVNAAHQLGSSLGLGLLVVVFAGAAGHSGSPRAELAHQITATLAASTAMLVVALLLVLLLLVRGAPPVRSIPQPVEVKP